MGFIEDLRKSTEDRLTVEHQRKTQEDVLQAAQEERKHQQETKEKAFKEGRRQEAEAFRQESGIGVLMEDLAGILKKAGKQDCSYAAPGHNYNSGYGRYDSNVGVSDPNSLRDQVSWNFWGGRRLLFGGGKIQQGGTCIITETSPDGTIIVHGGFGKTVIPLNRWRNDKNELEEAIKKAFHRPLNVSETYIPSPPNISAGNG